VSHGCDDLGQLLTAAGVEPDGVTARANEQLGYAYDPAANFVADE
jgi:hypothetical protein